MSVCPYFAIYILFDCSASLHCHCFDATPLLQSSSESEQWGTMMSTTADQPPFLLLFNMRDYIKKSQYECMWQEKNSFPYYNACFLPETLPSGSHCDLATATDDEFHHRSSSTAHLTTSVAICNIFEQYLKKLRGVFICNCFAKLRYKIMIV